MRRLIAPWLREYDKDPMGCVPMLMLGLLILSLFVLSVALAVRIVL